MLVIAILAIIIALVYFGTKPSATADTSSFALFQFLVLAPFFAIIFPLSALAFFRREVPRLVAQLKIDYAMLGTRPTKGLSTGRPETDEATSRWHGESYTLHCMLAMLAAGAGAAIFCWSSDSLKSVLDANTQRGMQLGFMGAYLYALNLIYRRYTTGDLQPHVYLSCAVGMVAGMAFNFVAFTGITKIASSPAPIAVAVPAQLAPPPAPVATPPPGDARGTATPLTATPAPAKVESAAVQPAVTPQAAEFTGMGAGVAAILAFALGYFPNLAIRWFGRISRTSMHESQRRSDALPLAMIDGISELHEARLQDEGIDNVQNLATGDIKDLVERTPFSAQQIVEWVDQALLYLYVNPGEIDAFRRAGVRSVTDFHDIWGKISIRYELKPDGSMARIPPPSKLGDFDQRRKDIAAQLATTEHRLDCLFLATVQGPNMDHVRTYWVNVQTARIQTRDILINQVCGSVGRALRKVTREGGLLKVEEVIQFLFAAEATLTGKDDLVSATPESLYGKAYLKMHIKEEAEARRLFEKCIEQFPEDPVAYNDLAWMDLQSPFHDTDLKVARDRARRAVRLAIARRLKADLAATCAEQAVKAAADLGTVDFADAEMAKDDCEIKQEEVKNFAADLASYRDTLALVEIRLGDISKGVEETLQAVVDWKDSGGGKQPKFLDTLIEAAESYIAIGRWDEAAKVLKSAEALNYAAPEQTAKIEELRKTLPEPSRLTATAAGSPVPAVSSAPDGSRLSGSGALSS
ncbi:MAG: tetratricopeptide repeat protein [Chthoniobacteraceae bacterium]